MQKPDGRVFQIKGRASWSKAGVIQQALVEREEASVAWDGKRGWRLGIKGNVRGRHVLDHKKGFTGKSFYLLTCE